MKSDHMMLTTSTDGVRVAYYAAGEGKPVVLVHGYASSRVQNWGSTGWIDRLTQSGFRVVSFDCAVTAIRASRTIRQPMAITCSTTSWR
jgi:hypothetical protein